MIRWFFVAVLTLGVSANSYAIDMKTILWGKDKGEADKESVENSGQELPEGPYPEKESFLSAAGKGEISRYLAELDYHKRIDINWSILSILSESYGMPSVYQYAKFPKYAGQTFVWDNRCLSASGEVPDILARFSQAKLHDLDGVNIDTFWATPAGKRVRSACEKTEFGKKYISALTKFVGDIGASMQPYADKLESERVAAKKEREEALRFAEEKSRQERAERERQAALREKKQAEEREQKSAEYQKRLAERNERYRLKAECRKTREHKMAAATAKIAEGKLLVQRGKEILEHEEKVGAVSGTTNLARKRRAGEMIVFGQGQIESGFHAYKVNGGTGSSPESVPVLKSPCAEL